MKESGVNKITRPINIGSSYIIVMLDSMQTKKFDERLREILKDKFEEWHANECKNLMKKLTFKS